MPPSAAAASVWEVQGLAAWLLPEPLGRELLAVGAAEAETRRRGASHTTWRL